MARWDAPIPVREGEMRRSDVVGRLSGEKTSKEIANYRVGNDEIGEVCFECVHYLIAGATTSPCRRVMGPVEARDLCDFFTPSSTEEGQGR